MFRLLATIFLVAAGTFIYSYFRELNPGSIPIKTGPETVFELNTVSVVLLAMAVGALAVAILVSAHQTSHLILNWRTNRLLRRKGKVDALHRDGTHAFMSKRTAEAVSLFERALVIDPNRTDSLLWLGNIYRSENNFGGPSGCTSKPIESRNVMLRSCWNWPKIWRPRSGMKKRFKRLKSSCASNRRT
jgi:hypothetical protein